MDARTSTLVLIVLLAVGFAVALTAFVAQAVYRPAADAAWTAAAPVRRGAAPRPTPPPRPVIVENKRRIEQLEAELAAKKDLIAELAARAEQLDRQRRFLEEALEQLSRRGADAAGAEPQRPPEAPRGPGPSPAGPQAPAGGSGDEPAPEVTAVVQRLLASSPVPAGPSGGLAESPGGEPAQEDEAARWRRQAEENAWAALALEAELNQVKAELDEANARIAQLEQASRQEAAEAVAEAEAAREAAEAAIRQLGAAAAPALSQMLTDPRPARRRWAAEMLATLGPVAREAIPALMVALADSDPDVRAAAERALDRLRE